MWVLKICCTLSDECTRSAQCSVHSAIQVYHCVCFLVYPRIVLLAPFSGSERTHRPDAEPRAGNLDLDGWIDLLLARILLDQLDISLHRCGHLRQTRRLARAAAVSMLRPRPSALPPAAPLRLFLNFFSTDHNWYQLIPLRARGFRHIPSQDKTETGWWWLLLLL